MFGAQLEDSDPSSGIKIRISYFSLKKIKYQKKRNVK